MKKIVIACDSFKGSLSSREVAEALAAGIREADPHCEVHSIPLADGGEGTLEALVEGLGGRYVEVEVSDPLGRPIRACYGRVDGGETAVVELARASGLTLLSPEERDPWCATTYGFGELIAHALRSGCRRLVLGIGGSATNDGGVGMLRALGFRFLDAAGSELIGGGEVLEAIEKIDASQCLSELQGVEIRVACDVRNPLCGAQGAAAVYGPQKGADPALVERLDRGLRHFAEVVEQYNGLQMADLPGAGAAGGVGGALVALLGARLERGIEWLLQMLRFESQIEGADLVITGEGCIDRQTLMGKLPMGVLQVARRMKLPCIALAGRVELCKELLESGFAQICGVTPEGQPLSEAMRPEVARENLRRAIHDILASDRTT